MSSCARCGHEVETSADFCKQCGGTLRDPERSRPTESLAGRTWVNGLIGGVTGFAVGLLLGSIFTPLYVTGMFAGGAIAGYLHARGSTAGTKVGALSGAFATAPVAVLLFASVLGVAALLLGAGVDLPPIAGGAFSVGVIVVIVVFGLVLATFANVLFGALGGLIGAAAREERQTR